MASEDLREFREEVSAWLEANRPSGPRPHDTTGRRAFDTAWQRTLFEGGWAGVSWPESAGGPGLSVDQQLAWYTEYGKLRLPAIDACFVGNSHAGPTLITSGTDAQRAEHLPRILRGETVWCQGFSEPDAGSDLAALRTRGRIDGDDLVVTGQKIWTSFADVADFQELLVRTDPDAPKHKGITWIICDMTTPGIDVRPIETIDGSHDFCEVFYDEVRIPLSNIVGEMNGGWSVAMATLGFERGPAFGLSAVQLSQVVEDLVDLASSPGRHDGRPAISDNHISHRLGQARAEAAALRSLVAAQVARVRVTVQPGAEASMLKAYYADVCKRVHRLAMDILGPDALLHPAGTNDDWPTRYLNAYAQSIAGGTSEIQRNIIGERVLGLPR